MELIDIDTTKSRDPHFYPQTEFETCTCQPVIDFHFLGKWKQYFRERFGAEAKDLLTTDWERQGFFHESH